MRVFLSYSSKQQDLAEQICIALEQSDHSVFFDRKSLRAGGNFRKRIRKELDKSETFVFLISPDSVALNCYALSELDIAREKWPQPEAHVLPVMAVPTDLQSVPAYLKAVTILEPMGEIVEAVTRRLDDWSPMKEVDPVDSVWEVAEETGAKPEVAQLLAHSTAIGAFMKEVLERGESNKTYQRRIQGIVKVRGGEAFLVPEMTEYKASAGREYSDERGRTCREVTLTYRRDGEWITGNDVFHLHRGKWVRDPTT